MLQRMQHWLFIIGCHSLFFAAYIFYTGSEPKGCLPGQAFAFLFWSASHIISSRVLYSLSGSTGFERWAFMPT